MILRVFSVVPSAGVTLATIPIFPGDFSDVAVPTVLTYSFANTYFSSQPLSFRIVKNANCAHGLSFQQLTVCAATDGSACSYQVPDSCPSPVPSPPTAAPSGETCSNPGGCCLYEPCCDGSTCADFGIYKICVNHVCAPTPAAATRAPTHSPITAYISTAFDLDLSFWQANQYELNAEYLWAVKNAIWPVFPNAEFGDVIVRAGSMVAAVPWVNVPWAVLNNPTVLNGFLPSRCFHFPEGYLLQEVL